MSNIERMTQQELWHNLDNLYYKESKMLEDLANICSDIDEVRKALSIDSDSNHPHRPRA